MRSASGISRREFVETTTGLVIAFVVPWRANAVPGPAAAPPFAPNAWVRIGTHGIVTLTIDKSEMGQGAQTGLAMILAEELDADWSTIRLGPMPENPAGWSRTMRTGGSNAIRSSWEPLRKAGATARDMLVTAAAQAWKVDRTTCRAERGAVIHVPTGRRLTYGMLAAQAAALPVPTDAPLKDPKDFRLVGTRMTRLDTPSKVDGSALFGIDVKLPGMLVASIERSPVLGGRLKRFNADRAKALPGVRHVVALEPSSWMGAKGAWAAGCAAGVAVVADSYWQAVEGRRALDIEWDEGDVGALDSGNIRAQLVTLADRPGIVAQTVGDAAAALAAAAKRIEAVYDVPFVHHATMEPMNCTAHVRSGECDRQGDLDPRRRHAERVLPPHELQPVRRGTRSRGAARRLDSPHRRHAAPAQVRTARKGDRRQSGGRRRRSPVCDTQPARGSGDPGSTRSAAGTVALGGRVAQRVRHRVLPGRNRGRRRPGPVRAATRIAARQAPPPPDARARRREGRVGLPAPPGPRARDRGRGMGTDGVRRGGRGVGGPGRLGARPSRGVRRGLWADGEHGSDRSPDAGRYRLRAERRVVWGDHARARSRGAGKLRHLPCGPDARSAGGGGLYRAEQRPPGRRR